MEILPVLDVMDSQVVRGVEGKRSQYRPIRSGLISGSDPFQIADAIHQEYSLSRFYLADLDAILGTRPPAYGLYGELAQRGYPVWVDAGVRRAEEAVGLLEAGAERVVAGLETLASPAELESIIATCGAERTLVSVDMQSGKPLSNSSWPVDPRRIVDVVIQAGAEDVLLLDLAYVGAGRGVGASELTLAAIERHPRCRFHVGGGVRNIGDLQEIADRGVAGCLIASALHDRAVAAEDLAAVRRQWRSGLLRDDVSG